jgi:hypothetical protein
MLISAPMRYFERIQPRGAWADLKHYLWADQPYRWVFLILSIMLTVLALAAFWVDSEFEPEYRREIVYVEQWPLTRTDKEIIAKQKVDEVIKQRRLQAEQRELEKRQRYFQQLKQKADPWL